MPVGTRRERGAWAENDELVVVSEGRVGEVVGIEDIDDAALGRDARAGAPDVARVFARASREKEYEAAEHGVRDCPLRRRPANVARGAGRGAGGSIERAGQRVEIPPGGWVPPDRPPRAKGGERRDHAAARPQPVDGALLRRQGEVHVSSRPAMSFGNGKLTSNAGTSPPAKATRAAWSA